MNCDKFVEHLDDFIDVNLNDLEMEAMQMHAASCPKCAQEMEARRALIEELGHLDDDVKAPEGLLKSTMERIHRERNPKKKMGWWIGGGIAAVLCVTVGGAALFGGAGGYRSESKAAYDMPASAAGSIAYSNTSDKYDYKMEQYAAEAEEIYFDAPMADAPAAEAPMPDMAADDSEYLLLTTTASEDNAADGKLQAEEYGLKIIREARIELQTENYTEDLTKLKALVAEFGGFITSSDENGSEAYTDRYGGANRWCEMTVRVPSGRLDAFIERFNEIGIVSFTSITETDVTAQYNDTDRRLESYKKQYDRVQAMMDMAGTVEELISIENELARLEWQIEEAQGSLNHWDSRVNMSTVNVYINEVRRATPVTENPTLGERMAESLAYNWYYFVEGCKDTLVSVYGSIPYIVTWIIVLGAIGGVTVLIVKKTRKKAGKKK